MISSFWLLSGILLLYKLAPLSSEPFQFMKRTRIIAWISLLATAWAQQPADPCKPLNDRIQSLESRLLDWPNLARYADADAKLPPPAKGEMRVVFLGDSITDLWNLPEYFPGQSYVNRGISGQTTPQMLLRFRPDVIDLQPAGVVILAGTNDLAGNTGPMTLEMIENNLASLAELAHAHSITIIFASVLPVSDYGPAKQTLKRPPDKILELNAWIKQYCKEHGLVYLDYYSRMLDPKGMLPVALSEDGLHPNAAGYKVMAPLAEEAIGRALQTAH
jgi:lysophospholipase L1-like esterase